MDDASKTIKIEGTIVSFSFPTHPAPSSPTSGYMREAATSSDICRPT